MDEFLTRVVGGGIVAVVLITVVGILFLPASPSQSFTVGLIGGSIMAVVHWYLLEHSRGNV